MSNARRKDFEVMREQCPEPEGFFYRANERSALPEDETAALDAMIEAHGTRNILRALKQLLDGRVDVDERRLDSRFGRAAQAIEWACSHHDVRALD